MADEHAAKKFRSAIYISRWIFSVAGVYGLLVLGSWMFITPKMVGHARYQQPEIYYGFGSIWLAWQVVFLLIARDPVRYRPLMLIAGLFEKLLFSTLLVWLMLRHIAGLHWLLPAAIDGVLGAAFLVAYSITPREPL